MGARGVGVRVGVDVGGTFTKAVACDASTGEVVARAVVPTTYGGPHGLAGGVVRAVGGVLREVSRLGAGPVLVVAHSTTQAVNALLEGDTAVVGILGIGRHPDQRRTRRRTRVGDIRVAPGRRLRTVHAFIDAGRGLSRPAVERAVGALVDRGAEALAVSEAFGVEDPSGERLALKVAADLGIPACAGHELSGLYGLQVRTITAALNASILPAALGAARVVEEAVSRDAPGVPLLVMRGDGGAADLASLRRRPLLTAFSGPAASVAGALRHLAVREGVVLEVGGTSTNVCAVRGGRPVLSYVRVLDHVTFVRSLDVRVVGVAGGSLLRVGRRLGRLRLTDVGPRSAHVAGLPYCAFARPEDLTGGQARVVTPRPGDPADYVVVETPTGQRHALTLTCAANALDRVPQGAYARGDGSAARAGFEALGRALGRDWRDLAREALDIAARKVGEVVAEVLREHALGRPTAVGLGGGAGALMPALGQAWDLPWTIPPDAEVISSIGDALSVVRVEVERTMVRPSAGAVADLVREAEEAAVAAGAAPATLQVETQAVPERGALRAVALGSVAVEAGAPEDGGWAGDLAVRAAAAGALGGEVEVVAGGPFFTVFATGRGDRRRFAVVDRRGTVAATGEGLILTGPGADLAGLLRERVPGLVRHLGPIAVAPAIRLIRGARLVDLTVFSQPDRALEAAVAECRLADGEPVVALLSRS